MNKRCYLRWFSFALLTAAVLVLQAGCEQVPYGSEFYEYTAPPDKLRQIEPLDLKEMTNHKDAQPDANEPPPAELMLTLEDCRAGALANNLSLKVELISPTIAAAGVSAEEAKFEWAFFSNIRHNKTDTPTSTTLTGSKRDNSNVDLGVEVPLRTGGNLRFDVIDGRTKTNNSFSTLNPSYSSDLAVSISQPLLRNAGKRANTHSIRIAEYDRQIVEARTKLEIIRVIANADRVYWRLYAARRELEVRKQQYDLADAQLAQARRFVDSGEMAQIEVVRAEAGLASRLEAIITAENSVRDRQRELKQILNRPALGMQTPTVMIPATEPDPLYYDLDAPHMVRAALDNRMEMLELEVQLARDVSTIDFNRNQALPLVTLDYTYNINGLGATRNDSYDVLGDKNFEDHRLGLQLLVPLGNQAAKNNLLRSFYARRQRLASRENRSQQIEREVLNAIDQLEANWQRILASRQNTVLAGRLFQAEQRQFELGLRTSTDVLDAQTGFADAQSAEIRALTEYQIAQVDIAFATGTLLGAARVQWQPEN
ncbi:MAG: TolC family protein [Planctomycetes bacterium]|nr:TolC family protein [Planctomycetota bacterium]